jgi:hypothetical protein
VHAVLRDDAFATQLAGMREDGRAVALNVLAELDAGPRIGEQPFEPRLALIERLRSPVLAVELEQVDRNASPSCARRWSFSATPASSQQTASPSIVTDAGRNAATAALMRGYRSVQS